jgi:SnoaL-like domain
MAMLTEAQLLELYDKQRLHDNLMLYCRGIDRMDEELVRSTYWPDSTDDHGGFVGPGQGWAAAGVAWRDKIHNNNHHVSNVLIELEGNRAKRESMFINVVNLKDGNLSFFMGGRYRDLCEKRDGEWRILHRVCIWDWFEHQATRGGWELCGMPRRTNWGRFFPDDPIYKNWENSPTTEFPRSEDQYSAGSG